jgi:hypothetical protein
MTSNRPRRFPLNPGFQALVVLGVVIALGTLAWDASTGGRYFPLPEEPIAFHPTYVALVGWLVVALWIVIRRRADALSPVLAGLLFLLYWLLDVVELAAGFTEPIVTSEVGTWTYEHGGPLGFALLLGTSSTVFLLAGYALWHTRRWATRTAVIASLFTIVVFVSGALLVEATGRPVGATGVFNPYWLPLWLLTLYLLRRADAVDDSPIRQA